MHKRRWLFLPGLLLLVAAVPWFYGESNGPAAFGLPNWGLHAIGASFVYACVTAFSIGRWWDASAGEPDEIDPKK